MEAVEALGRILKVDYMSGVFHQFLEEHRHKNKNDYPSDDLEIRLDEVL